MNGSHKAGHDLICGHTLSCLETQKQMRDNLAACCKPKVGRSYGMDLVGQKFTVEKLLEMITPPDPITGETKQIFGGE